MCNHQHRLPLPGTNHLYTILISESLFLIWKLRCEWRRADPAYRPRSPPYNPGDSKPLADCHARLQLDCPLTNRRRYGRKALPSSLIQSTW